MNKLLKRFIFTKSTSIDPTDPVEIFKFRAQNMKTTSNPEDVLKTFNSIQGLRFGFKHTDENLKSLIEDTVDYLKRRPMDASHLMLLIKETANLGICDRYLWQSYKEKFDKLLKTENLNKTTFLRTCLYFEKHCPVSLSSIKFDLNDYRPLFDQIKKFLKAHTDPKSFEDSILFDSLTSNEDSLANPKALDVYFRSNNFNIDRNAFSVYLRVLAESDALENRDNRIASYNLSSLLVQQLDKDLAKHLDITISDTEFEHYTEYTWRSICNLIRFTVLNPDIPNDDLIGLERYLFDKQQHSLIDFKSFTDVTQTIADNSDVFKDIGFKIMIDLCNMMWHQIENEPSIFQIQSEHDLLVFIQSINIIIEERVLNKDISFRLFKIADDFIQIYKAGGFVRNDFQEYINNEIAEFEKFRVRHEQSVN